MMFFFPHACIGVLLDVGIWRQAGISWNHDLIKSMIRVYDYEIMALGLLLLIGIGSALL